MNPLVEVVCQLKFPAVLRIASEIPTIFQERIRHRFPLFRTQTVANLFGNIDGFARLHNVGGSNVIYEFISEDNAWTVSLSSEHLTLTSKQYEKWEDFLSYLEQPMAALLDIYEPAFFSRIGLRYQDVIRRSRLGIEGMPWSRLLKPEIISFMANPNFESSVLEIASQTLLSIDNQGGRVRIQHGFAQLQGDSEICYLIDSDFFIDSRIGIHDGLTSLNKFNQASGNLFRWCITDELRSVLQPQPME